MKKKKAKKPVTYEHAHNRALKYYSKTSLFLLWVGVLNVLAVLIGIIQVASNPEKWPSSGYALSLSVQILINNAFLVTDMPIWTLLVMFLISTIFGAGFILCGLLATKGYKVPLFIGTSLYLVDFAFLFPIYFLWIQKGPWVRTNFAFTLVVHVFILGGLAIAIYEYYRILKIEKKYKGQVEFVVEPKVKTKEIANANENKEINDDTNKK